MKRKIQAGMRRSAAALALLLLSVAPSSQATIWCNGRITGVLTDNVGNVMAYTTFRNDWLQVCNIDAPWKGVSVAMCKTWAAQLVALRLSQEEMTFYYSEYPDGTSCLAVPNYTGAPAPGYIAISPP
jgi:hypothetical protein